jgi:DMSO/TMAO reductase YedYZ molybdopterin-dependent catalytic subunit
MTRLADPHATGSPHSLEPTDGPPTLEEVQLAFRNRGMPLEALRYDLTPTGLHYLVIHWDIPETDASTWRVAIRGRVARPIEIGLDDLLRRPRRTIPVTLECAGNGRGRHGVGHRTLTTRVWYPT